MLPLKSSTTAAEHNRLDLPAAHVDDSAVWLLWLFAAAVVLPAAVDLPFTRGEVATASQLDSLVGRSAFVALGLVAASTIIRGTRPSPLFGALACLWGVLFGISCFMGDTTVELTRYFWMLLLAIAFSTCRIDLPRLLWHAKVILRVFLMLSLTSILVAPEYAWFLINGRQWLGVPQLAGVTQHPNALGPIAALALVLELTSPERRYLRWMFGALALAILVLTQSRGGWAAAVVGLLVLALLPQGKASPGRLLSMLPFVIGVVFFLITKALSGDISSGRIALWNNIIERSFARQSWLFGNGNGVYIRLRGSSEGFASWVGQGHNQFVDSFFTGGIVALALLSVLTFVCARWALRAGPNRRIALATFAVLLVQMMVEAPLRQAASPWSLMSVIVLAIITAHGGGVERSSPATHLHRSSPLRRQSH
jgi:O-antigen ligase